MSKTLNALYRSGGAIGLLRAFGLHRILTDQDDPELWAAALMRHWHAPSDTELQPTALRFGVSKPVQGELGDTSLARSGMEPLEEWCFERVEVDQLRPVECRAQPAPSFMGMLMGGDPLAAASGSAAWVRDYLEVSRPSLGQSKALVHAGMSAPVNAGCGETRVWTRVEDGTWVETDEIVARWLA